MAKARKRATKTKKATNKVVVAKSSLPKLAVPKIPKIDARKVRIGLGIVAVVAVLYFFKGLFVAAWVNGHPITRIALVQELEKQDGGQVLNSLVTKELILEEARKNNVSVSQDEINSEVSKVEESIKAQGQTLDDALATQGWTRSDLEEQIRIQLLVERILGDKVKVTDQEVEDYMKTSGAGNENKDDVMALLKQQKLMSEYQTWVSGLLAQAKVNYWLKY